jgi:hypothetical protein
MIFDLRIITAFIAAAASLTFGVNAARQTADVALARVVRSCTRDKVAALTFVRGVLMSFRAYLLTLNLCFAF